MEKVLHNAIKQQIQALKDISFQYFIDELYLKHYLLTREILPKNGKISKL